MKALRHFIQSAFTVAELKMFIADNYPAISPSINWQASATTVVFDVVTALRRHGLVDGHLLDALGSERPSRKDDIDHLFALLGLPKPAAAPAPLQPAIPGAVVSPAPAPAAGGAEAHPAPEDDAKRWDIFLAHGSPDKPRVRPLYKALRTLAPDLRVFFDEASIQPGAVWPRAIRAALESSRLAVVLVSNQVKGSWYLEAEVHEMIALMRQGKLIIVPVFLDGFANAYVPHGLGPLHGVDVKALGGKEAMRRVVGLLG